MNLIGKFRWKKSKILLVFSLIAALISVQSLQIVANASQGDSTPDFSNPTVIAGDSDSLYQAVQNASDGDVIGINGTIEVNAGINSLGNPDKTIYLVRMNEGACLKIKGQTELVNLIIDGRSLNTSSPMLYIDSDANCYLSSCTIQNCINQDNGGAIYCKGHIGVNNSFLKNNQAKNGGHIYLAAGSASLYQSEASGGIASEAGGAIYNKAFTSSFQIMDSKLHSNTSGIIAGGICNFSTLKIIRSAIYGNSSPNASDISNSQYSSLEMPELNELMETYQAAGIIPTEWVSDVSADIEWQISRDYDLTNEKAMMKLTYQTIGNSDDTGDNDNPDEGNTGDSGNTDDSGNSGDAGNADDSGNSSDTGNTDDSGNSGDSGNTDDSGNSGDGGNTDDSGNGDNTDDNGNSSDTGNADDSENSGDTGNTDDSGNAGDSNGSDNPDSGNSGDNNNSDTGDNGNTEDSGNSGDTGNTGDNGNQDTGDKPDTDDSGNSDNSGNTNDNKKDDTDNQGNSSDTGDKNNNETSNSNNTTNTQGDTSTTSTNNNITTTDDCSDNSKSDYHNSTTNNTTNNYYDRSAADGNNNKRTSDSSNGSSTVNSTINYYSGANPNTTANVQENTVSGNTASNQDIQLPDNIKLNLTNVDVVYEMVNGRSNIEISTNQTSSVEQTSTQTVQQEQVPMTTALASAPVSTAKEVKQSSVINWYEIVKLVLLGAIIILIIPKKRKISVNKEN